MKKFLFLIMFMLMTIPNISEARNVHYRYPYHSCVSCGTYNAHKHWHHEYGWWLPVGVIIGALAASSVQNYETQRVYSTPTQVYYVPDYRYTPYYGTTTIIRQDPTNPNIIYYIDN